MVGTLIICLLMECLLLWGQLIQIKTQRVKSSEHLMHHKSSETQLKMQWHI